MNRHHWMDAFVASNPAYCHLGSIEGVDVTDVPAPPFPLLPTETEAGRLPRSARLAFAGRCAARVAPLFRIAWPDAPADQRSAVESAVKVAEDPAADEPARAAASFAAAAAADAAGRAKASVSLDAARTVARATAGDDVFIAVYAARSAADTLVRAATTRTPVTRQLRAIRRDFDRLLKLTEKHNWTDDTPVPANAFGPMWPDGPPSWWSAN